MNLHRHLATEYVSRLREELTTIRIEIRGLSISMKRLPMEALDAPIELGIRLLGATVRPSHTYLLASLTCGRNKVARENAGEDVWA